MPFSNMIPDLGQSRWSEFDVPAINPATATKSSNDNKSNTFLSGLFDIGKSAANIAAKTWVDKQIEKNASSERLRQEQSQFAANYWGLYNGSGPIDPGLAAINSRLDPTGKFYANPIANANNPQSAPVATQTATIGNLSIFAGIAIVGVLLIALIKR